MNTSGSRFWQWAVTAVVLLVLAATSMTVISLSATSGPDGSQEPRIDPCEGLSQADCDSLVVESRATFDVLYADWFERFLDAGIDPKRLERIPLNASYVPPEPDLDAATRAADLIVHVIARDVTFTENGLAEVTLEVKQAHKGDVSADISIIQAGGPLPNLNWEGAVLGFAENDPMLLPDQEAVLFLEWDEALENYAVQGFSGHYAIEDGKIKALEGNPFAAEVDNVDVADFSDEIATIVGSEH